MEWIHCILSHICSPTWNRTLTSDQSNNGINTSVNVSVIQYTYTYTAVDSVECESYISSETVDGHDMLFYTGNSYFIMKTFNLRDHCEAINKLFAI